MCSERAGEGVRTGDSEARERILQVARRLQAGATERARATTNFVGEPIQDPRFCKETVKFDKMGLWSAPTKQMEDEELCLSNAVVVKKTDKVSRELKRRLTVDFRGPNSRISPPSQQIPTVSELSELSERTGKAVLFDKDDGISGYYQWKLHENSKRFTGVYTPVCVCVQVRAAGNQRGAFCGMERWRQSSEICLESEC